MTNTPGYNCRLAIRLSTDRNGKSLAHYWSYRAARWIRLGMVDAQHMIVSGTADVAA